MKILDLNQLQVYFFYAVMGLIALCIVATTISTLILQWLQFLIFRKQYKEPMKLQPSFRRQEIQTETLTNGGSGPPVKVSFSQRKIRAKKRKA